MKQSLLSTAPQNNATDSSFRHPREGRGPGASGSIWIPAFAGMTSRLVRISDTHLCGAVLRLNSIHLCENPPGIPTEAGIQGNSLDSRLRGKDDRVTRGNDDRVTRLAFMIRCAPGHIKKNHNLNAKGSVLCIG
jgi:hypothetical protein